MFVGDLYCGQGLLVKCTVVKIFVEMYLVQGFFGNLYCGQGLLMKCTVFRVCW